MAGDFALALPVTVAAGGWLALRSGGGPLSQAALALLLLTPAMGARLWAQSLVELDVAYVSAAQVAMWIPQASARCLEGGAGLLLGAAVALALLGAPRPAGLLALGAVASVASQQQVLVGVGRGLQEARWQDAAWSGLLLPAWGLLPVVGLLLLRPRLPQPDRRHLGLWLALALGTAGLSIAPLPRLVGALPLPSPLAAVPMGPAGLPMGRAPILLPGADVRARLREGGLHPSPRDRWWCEAPKPRWSERIRATAILAAEADTTLQALAEVLRTAALHNVHLLALQGQAPAPAPGALGARLAHPAVRFLLDPAPAQTPRATFEGTAVRWSPQPPSEGATCILTAGPELTVGEVYAQGRQLGDPGGACGGGLGLDLRWALLPCPENAHGEGDDADALH